MRYPIYSAASNPRIDPPGTYKKIAYVLALVQDGLARWIDEQNKHLGVKMVLSGWSGREESQADFGTFSEAWGITPSGPTRIGVWQLRTKR